MALQGRLQIVLLVLTGIVDSQSALLFLHLPYLVKWSSYFSIEFTPTLWWNYMHLSSFYPLYNPSFILQTAVSKTDSIFLHTMMGLTLIFNVKGKNMYFVVLIPRNFWLLLLSCISQSWLHCRTRSSNVRNIYTKQYNQNFNVTKIHLSAMIIPKRKVLKIQNKYSLITD